MKTTTHSGAPALDAAHAGQAGARLAGAARVALLLIWPWLLLLINRNWVFPNVWVDEWLYFGYFVNLPEHLALFSEPSLYHSTRLAWTLPGYLVHRTFPFPLSHYILHLSLYYIATLSLYFTCVLLDKHRSGLVATLLLGTNSFFLHAISWDYVDSAGISYLLLTTLLVTLVALRPRQHVWAILAGMVYAAALYTNLFLAALAPGLAVYFLILRRFHAIGQLVASITAMLAGVAITTICLGLASVSLGGQFWFYKRSVLAATMISTLSENSWIARAADWPIRHAHLVYLWIALVGTALGFLLPWARRRYQSIPGAFAVGVQFGITATLAIVIQLRSGTPLLNAAFYASYLIPSTFLALSVILDPLCRQLSQPRFVFFAAGIAIAGLLSFALRACWSPSWGYPALPALVLGIVVIIALLHIPQQLSRLAFGAITVALSSLVFVVPSGFNLAGSVQYCVVAPPPAVSPQSRYEAVITGIRTISQHVPNKRVVFWYNSAETDLYASLAGAYLKFWSLGSETFPEFDAGAQRNSVKALQPGLTIVLLSKRDAAIQQAAHELAEHDLTLNLIGRETIPYDDSHFNLTIFSTHSSRTFAPGETIDLTRPSEAQHVLQHGWGRAESFGTWTDGAEATIAIDRGGAVPAGRDLVLTLDIPYHIAQTAAGQGVASPPLDVDVLVAGRMLDPRRFDATTPGGEWHIRIPAGLLQQGTPLTVTLVIREPHSPQDLGFDPYDSRQLGIAVRSLRLAELP